MEKVRWTFFYDLESIHPMFIKQLMSRVVSDSAIKIYNLTTMQNQITVDDLLELEAWAEGLKQKAKAMRTKLQAVEIKKSKSSPLNAGLS